MPDFKCVVCGAEFALSQQVLDRFPGWKPRHCRLHKGGGSGGAARAPKRGGSGGSGGGGRGRGAAGGSSREENLRLQEVLQRYSGGPQSGVFTDGGCTPNPGPGGWGVVHVQQGRIVAQKHGHERQTTNNRMELTALIEALKLLPEDADLPVYSDSQLCVRTINEWAAGWEKRGWTRKAGPIKNLELVQELYALSRARPRAKLTWIAAHSGNLWNEYADSLASAWSRAEL